MKKNMYIAAAAITAAVGATTLTGVKMASAATSPTTTDGQSSLIQKLVAKFNLKEADVKAVFEQEHSEREAARQKDVEAKLTQLVTDGKITADQKTKIIAKLAELKTKMEANRDAMKDKTQAERKAAMDAQKTELETWAKDNGISTDYLSLFHGGGHGGPRGGGHGHDDAPSTN